MLIHTAGIEKWIQDKLGRLIIKPSRILIPILIITILLTSSAAAMSVIPNETSKWDWETSGGTNERSEIQRSKSNNTDF